MAFYRRTRPYAALWGPIAAAAPDVKSSTGAGRDFLNWILGCALIYGSLFGVGKLILHEPLPGLAYLAASAIAAWAIYRSPAWQAED
jgi:hypothetical protein